MKKKTKYTSNIFPYFIWNSLNKETIFFFWKENKETVTK